MWHLNTPLEVAIKNWRKTLKAYPNAIFLINNVDLFKALEQVYPRVYFLPRFIDPSELPEPKENKEKDTLWFGNAWLHHQDKYELYLENHKDWISRGEYNGRSIKREQALNIVNNTHKVWAIGLCAMEAKYLGCEVVEYDGNTYDILLPQDVQRMLKEILDGDVVKPTQQRRWIKNPKENKNGKRQRS